MTAARKPVQKPVKVTDEAALVRCAAADGLIREEVWRDVEGNVVRFNLAFIFTRETTDGFLAMIRRTDSRIGTLQEKLR
jgi:hypothetical protein